MQVFRRVWRAIPPLQSPKLGILTAAPGGAIVGATSVAFSTSGTLTGKGALAGATAPAFSTSGTLTARVELAGATAPAFSTSGTLTGKGVLAGATVPAFTTAGAIAGRGALSGSADLSFSLTGALAGGEEPAPEPVVAAVPPVYSGGMGGKKESHRPVPPKHLTVQDFSQYRRETPALPQPPAAAAVEPVAENVAGPVSLETIAALAEGLATPVDLPPIPDLLALRVQNDDDEEELMIILALVA